MTAEAHVALLGSNQSGRGSLAAKQIPPRPRPSPGARSARRRRWLFHSIADRLLQGVTSHDVSSLVQEIPTYHPSPPSRSFPAPAGGAGGSLPPFRRRSRSDV